MVVTGSGIDLTADQYSTVVSLLRRHLPHTLVWAYGSRVKWASRPESDLDIVAFCSSDDTRRVVALREAFEQSDLPFRVDVLVWDSLPESFHSQIKTDYVVLADGQDGAGSSVKWPEVSLGDVCDFRGGSVFKRKYQGNKSGDYPFIKVSDMNLPINATWIQGANNWVDDKVAGHLGCRSVPKNTTVFAKIGEALKSNRFRMTVQRTFIDNNMMAAIPDQEVVEADFLFYAMHQFDMGEIASGTALPYLTQASLAALRLRLPTRDEQRAIGRILSTLDERIELNRRMRDSLEEMSRTLFKSWFVDFDPVRAKMKGRWRHGESPRGLPARLYDLFPDRLVSTEFGDIPEGWKVQSLDTLADFTNGLAMQKFPPDGDEWLPVIKIAEMRRGFTDRTARASRTIDPRYIVQDGDVLFSWSGSLELVLWSHGPGALNQHLFKVTSDRYPRWFYWGWTREHLDSFRAIAAGKATTMGHIRRRHLTDAKVAVPPANVVKAADEHLSVLLGQQVVHAVQNRILASLRDVLLPELVSGRVFVELDDAG